MNPILNAIVDSRFDAAIQEARKVDEFLLWSRKTEEEMAREMPLLGVPMTVKESIAVQGLFRANEITDPKRSKFLIDLSFELVRPCNKERKKEYAKYFITKSLPRTV